MKILIRSVMALVLLAQGSLWAQQPYAVRIDRSVGLPSNSVYNLLQDTKGYIWIAHNEGLSRYDGFEFKSYESPLQTSRAGSALREDRLGRVWYENFDGYAYYVAKDSLKMLNRNKPIGYFPIGITDQYVFLIQKDGVDVFDLESLTYLKSIPIAHIDISYSISDAKAFYLMSGHLLYKIADDLIIESYAIPEELVDSEKHLYYLGNQLAIVQKTNKGKKVYTLKDSKIHELIEVQDLDFIQGAHFIDSSYWFLTPKGAYKYTYFDNKAPEKEVYFADKNISFLLKDKQHNFWFSTVDEGIILVPNINNSIKTLNGQMPNRIVKGANDYIIATKQGAIKRLSKTLEENTHKNISENNLESIYYLYFDSVSQSVFYVSRGLSIAPRGDFENILKQDLALKEICRIDDKYYAIAATGPSGLLLSPTMQSNALSPWDALHQSNNVYNLSYSAMLSQSRGKSVVYSPSQQIIYYATNLGFFKVTLKGSEEIKLYGESLFLSKLAIWKDTVYALSTKGNLYSIYQEAIKPLHQQYKVADGDIIQIKQFDQWLFLIRKSGLYVLDMSNPNLTFNRIDIDIHANEINDLLLDQQQLLLLTDSGIILLEFKLRMKDPEAPMFYINSLKINDRIEDIGKPLSFTHNDNNVEVNYSLLNFGSSEPANIYYQINEDGWKPASNETRTLKFPALAPGNYHISFKVDEIVIADATIQFTIGAPFWLTWWFLAICISVLFAMAYAYYTWRTGILIKQNQLLKDKISLEQSLSKSMLIAIKSQMNPHFFYNALNTIQSYIFTNDKRNASNYLAKFSKLTRMILEMSEKETIYLNEEVTALHLYLELEKMRFNNDFEYEVKIEESVDTDMVKIPSMIIQPYVENAVKHGLLHKRDEKKLEIIFRKRGEALMAIVDDNGIGRKRSEELNKIRSDKYQSFSSHANEKRLEILNKGKSATLGIQIIDKLTEDGMSLGTRIELTIPIS